jgi:DNA polymerase
MSDEREELLRSARQLVETDVLLGGDLIPAVRNPLPAPRVSAGAPTGGPTPAGLAREAAAPQGEANPKPSAPPRWGTLPPLELESLPQTSADKAAALEALREICLKCCCCGLGKTRTNLVFGEGSPAAALVFVGEAPGEDEDRTGRPFVGRAGQKLTEMIVAMGLTREDVYICNMLRCRPPNNRTPAPEEVQACWPYLIRQLQIIRPKAIVTLGNPATQNLLQTATGITRLRGQWQKLPGHAPGLGGIAVMPTFHPSYLIRAYTPENRRNVWNDLQKVMELLGLSPKK